MRRTGCGDVEILFLDRGNVLGGQGRAFAKKILFHLLHDYFLVFTTGGIQAVFIQKHFAEFGPASPSLAGDLIVDFVPQVGIEGRLVQTWQFFVELGAENFVLWHEFLEKSTENYLTPRWMYPRTEKTGKEKGPPVSGPSINPSGLAQR
jgi:hypothetical protein